MIDEHLLKINLEINSWAEREMEMQFLQKFCNPKGLAWRWCEWMRRICEKRRRELIQERDRLRNPT